MKYNIIKIIILLLVIVTFFSLLNYYNNSRIIDTINEDSYLENSEIRKGKEEEKINQSNEQNFEKEDLETSTSSTDEEFSEKSSDNVKVVEVDSFEQEIKIEGQNVYYEKNDLNEDSSVVENKKEIILETEKSSQVNCLKDAGFLIYGSYWCPACRALVESLGGYDLINPIYVECTESMQKCQNEKLTNYVPEIQINGKLYQGERTLKSMMKKTDCDL